MKLNKGIDKNQKDFIISYLLEAVGHLKSDSDDKLLHVEECVRFALRDLGYTSSITSSKQKFEFYYKELIMDPQLTISVITVSLTKQGKLQNHKQELSSSFSEEGTIYYGNYTAYEGDIIQLANQIFIVSSDGKLIYIDNFDKRRSYNQAFDHALNLRKNVRNYLELRDSGRFTIEEAYNKVFGSNLTSKGMELF